MGNNFLSALFAAIRQRFSSIIMKVTALFNVRRMRNIFLQRLINFFQGLFDVKPKDKDDYYQIFNYLVSKRLAYLIVVLLGVASFAYVWNVNGSYLKGVIEGDGVKTYEYNSILLRLADGHVKIKAKPGYVAYEGNVSRGYCVGQGTLFDKDSNIVYIGEFKDSMYNGNGVAYYPNQNVQYDGSFINNVYEGEGELYRANGTIEYKGGFSLGHKEGTGELYDNGGNVVYTGRFSNDGILYSELLGKSASEISEAYTGLRDVYEGDSGFVVDLKAINAMYDGTTNVNSLEDEVIVNTVYVLSDTFYGSRNVLSDIDELMVEFGEPVYEGNSYITQTEAVAIDKIRQNTGDKYYDDPKLVLENLYDDYKTIENYDYEDVVYLYSYRADGLIYTFVCKDRDSGFGFYYITKEEAGA